MDKEKLLIEANRGRQVAITLAENIYRYLGDVISKDELKAIVDSLISDAIISRLDHLYLKKDTYQNTFITGFLDDPINANHDIDTTDTLNIIDT